jgi:outer membrane protein assembly factor BamA
MQCGLNLSLFVDQPTISSISSDKVVSENDTATITCTVDSIPHSIIRWIFETKELQNKYDGSLTLNKIDCLSMGRYTCQAVNMLGSDNRYVDTTVKCEYYILVTYFHYLVLTFNHYM